MKGLTSDIITALKAATYTYTVDPDNIRESGQMRLNGYPSIVVSEVVNTSESAIGSREMLTALTYQIEVYAKNIVVSNVPVGRDTVARTIASDLDDELRTTFILRRISGNLVPFDDDTSRYVLRYDCVVTEKNYIYRPS